MIGVRLRLTLLPIYVNDPDTHLCQMPSSAAEMDGCPCMIHDDEGDVFCGAFGQYLDPVEDSDPEIFQRATACLNGSDEKPPEFVAETLRKLAE